MKIHITGNAGSGKTTLAARLGTELNLPVHGLDSVVWSAGWQKTAPEIRAAGEERMVAGAGWVIEGVSGRVRNAADVIILLDVDRLTCYWRCLRRNWRYLFRSRPGLPDRCPEILIIPRLCQIIWRFPSMMLPQVLVDMARSDSLCFRVRNDQELQVALAQISAVAEPGR